MRQVTLRSSEMGVPLRAMSPPLTFNRTRCPATRHSAGVNMGTSASHQAWCQTWRMWRSFCPRVWPSKERRRRFVFLPQYRPWLSAR